MLRRMKNRSRDGLITGAVLVATAARESGLLTMVCDHFTRSPEFGQAFGTFVGSVIAGLFAWGYVKRPQLPPPTVDPNPPPR